MAMAPIAAASCPRSTSKMAFGVPAAANTRSRARGGSWSIWGRQRGRMAERRDAADGETGHGAHEGGVQALDRLADMGADLGLVDPVAAGDEGNNSGLPETVPPEDRATSRFRGPCSHQAAAASSAVRVFSGIILEITDKPKDSAASRTRDAGPVISVMVGCEPPMRLKRRMDDASCAGIC